MKSLPGARNGNELGRSMRKIFFFMITLYIAAVLTGCETVKGLGKDIENTGSAVQHSLNR